MTELANREETSSLIGGGLLGIVTTGMYDAPLSMYREYIQNSADALDGYGNAKKARVEIAIDVTERRVRIRDYGPGLSHEEVLDRLLPIGRSNKKLGIDRGFRGIGRLSALPFAETVAFTTRTCQAELVTRITWHSGRLPDLTAPSAQLEQVIRGCVDIETLPGSEYPDHFFEVEVGGVARHSAGLLLNRDAVRDYIGEVCPVPMSTAFPFATQVGALVAVPEPPLELDVVIEGDSGRAERPYPDTIRLSANKVDEFTDFEEIHIPKLDGNGDAAVGWIAHSSYLGALPKELRIRGVRARAGNIQVGGESVFDELFAEERFNRWCVGEIHILDPRITPNARRDYFQPGHHLRDLENHLRPVLRQLSSRCRQASVARNRHRKSLLSLCGIEDLYDLAASGYLATEDSKVLVERALQETKEFRESAHKNGFENCHLERLGTVEANLKNFDSEAKLYEFGDIPLDEITVYQKVFQALAILAPSPSSAKELIEAVLAETSDGMRGDTDKGASSETNGHSQ